MNIVFDIGGTNMRVATAQNGELGEIKKVPTPQDPKEGVATLGQIARELSSETVECIVGDVPGYIDTEGRIFQIPHLQAWADIKIAEEVSRELNAPAHVFNDTAVVGYGELKRGAGRGFGKIVYITVSTGVGGTFINESDLGRSEVLGVTFQALKKSLETQISGTAVQKKFGIPPKELDSLEERNKLADILAAGLAEIAEKWKPDVFVIGGSMIVGVNPIPLERVREKFTAIPVTMASLGDNGGLIGAAILASRPQD